jgi:hypothetical protein
MRHGVFCHGKHLQNVAAETALNGVEVNLCKILTHLLFGSIVDQNVKTAESERDNQLANYQLSCWVNELVNVLLNRLFARLIVHQITWNQ